VAPDPETLPPPCFSNPSVPEGGYGVQDFSAFHAQTASIPQQPESTDEAQLIKVPLPKLPRSSWDAILGEQQWYQVRSQHSSQSYGH